MQAAAMKFFTTGGDAGSQDLVRGLPGMTDFPPLDEEKLQIRMRLHELEIEHLDLDDVIRRLSLDPAQDQLQLRRLKKRKLVLKDQIARLRAQLIPDIIA
jgi:hypothetical protein